MRKNLLRLFALYLLMLSSASVLALPFTSFDPRSMAMGSTGVAATDPSTAPFFNPAMLSATDPSKKFSFEFVTLGVSLIDPGKLHTNATSLSDAANSLGTTGTSLTTNASALTASTTALTGSITALSTSIAGLQNFSTITTVGQVTTAVASLSPLATSISSVTTNMGSVSANATAVGANVTTLSSNTSTINQALQSLNNQPLQGEFGAATVIAIPSKEWGLAVYANAWGAMGGALIYKDAATMTTVTTALSTTGTNLTGIGTATGSAATDLATAKTALDTAITNCAASLLVSQPAIDTCTANLKTAQTKLNTAQATITTPTTGTSAIVTTNSGNITTAANSVNANTTLQSQLHIRGVAVAESGLSISHGMVTNDVEWSWGLTPKVMQLRLYDATIGASDSLSNVTSDNYLAYYSTLNFDAGLAKVFLNGWRSGIVVKNVLPQTFEFKNSNVATGAKLNLNPQVRVGLGYEQVGWFAVALDADLTRNDPAGLEDPSQFVALGAEFSISGWSQLRIGYRADMVNAARNVASVGMGFSPRIPFFKPHFDLALTASPDIFNNGLDGVTQVGAYMKFGINF